MTVVGMEGCHFQRFGKTGLLQIGYLNYSTDIIDVHTPYPTTIYSWIDFAPTHSGSKAHNPVTGAPENSV